MILSVGLMVKGRVVLGDVVNQVGGTICPVVPELVLGFAATRPVKMHIHRLGALGDNGSVSDTNHGRVVGLD